MVFLFCSISLKGQYSEVPKVSNGYANERLLIAGAGTLLLVSFAFDDKIQDWRNGSYSPFLDTYIEPFGREYSLIGSVAFYGYSLLAKDRRAGKASISLGKALVYSYLSTNALKMVFRRSRPNEIGYPNNVWFQYDGPPVVTNSFPSGHATYAASIATVLTLSYPENDWLPWVSWGMASMVGFERVYNGRHHLSDVIAGYILGYYVGKLAVKPWKIDAYFLPGSAGVTVNLD